MQVAEVRKRPTSERPASDEDDNEESVFKSSKKIEDELAESDLEEAFVPDAPEEEDEDEKPPPMKRQASADA